MRTHTLPQPDHAGSAVIRYVSLGLPGFGSFEWDEPRGLAWLAGWLVHGDIARQTGISAHLLPANLVSQRDPAPRAGRYLLFATPPRCCPACQFRYNLLVCRKGQVSRDSVAAEIWKPTTATDRVRGWRRQWCSGAFKVCG